MKKLTLKNLIGYLSIYLSIYLFSGNIYAQNIGINATGATPDAGAGLDVNFTNKGVLLPRVNIANLNAIAPIAGSTTTSLLVYNTNTTTGTGYYYWNGSRWVRIFDDNNGKFWSLSGNAALATDFIGTTNNQPLIFRTNNVERMRVNANGNIGLNCIPNSNNNTVSSVQNTTTGTAGFFNLTSNSSWSAIEGASNSTTAGTGVRGTGFTGVYGSTVTSAGWAGFFDYDTYVDWLFYGGSTLISDRRIKTNIMDINNALFIINKLEPVKYQKKRGLFDNNSQTNITLYQPEISDYTEYGFIAQDIEKILPELVKSKRMLLKNGEEIDLKGVDYEMIIPIAVKAIKEQQTMINAQQSRIDKLEKKVDQLLKKSESKL